MEGKTGRGRRSSKERTILIVWAISGNPLKGRIFFFCKPLEPPRAGIIASTFFSVEFISAFYFVECDRRVFFSLSAMKISVFSMDSIVAPPMCGEINT